MLDTADNKIYFPRFYDIDTICSYDNSGQLKFNVDIEMEQGYWNTSSSRLWTRIRDLMHDDIVTTYNNMRQNGVSYENMMKYIYDEQIAKIPQTYYNKDYDVKYAPFADSYIGMAHGDTYEHVKRWLKQRFTFVDTLFDYAPSYNNDVLTIRANTTELMTLEIETYTPVYQHLSWYNGQMDKKKIDGKVSVEFSGTAQAATDQEVLIYGGSNVKSIKGITSMNPNRMLIGSATKLVEIDAHDCPLLADINANKANLSPHEYLNKVDLSNCPLLEGNLRLNNSPLVQEINIKGTKITGMNLPSSIRNLQVLRLPNTMTELSLNDAGMLHTLEFDEGVALQSISMTNCNALENVINFDLLQTPSITLNNSYNTAAELYFRDTTNLSLSNMNNLERVIFTPNNEYEIFELINVANAPDYKVTTFNCPKLSTFMTTAPYRESYNNGDYGDIQPNTTFTANSIDISTTQFTDVKLLCTTDTNTLKLPTTVKNFYCDSSFDLDTDYLEDGEYDVVHGELVEPYTTDYEGEVLLNNETPNLIPSSADGSLIFSMYAPSNAVAPASGTWDLYGLEFDNFHTFGMNNDVIQDSEGNISMPARYDDYSITIKNAYIAPKTHNTMLYPLLVNEDNPITGTLDYTNYAGKHLSWSFAYTDEEYVNITQPKDELLNSYEYRYNAFYDTEYEFDNPYEIAKYTSSASGLLPTFNSEFTYTYDEIDNGDGTYTTKVYAEDLDNLPTRISFSGKTTLLSVDKLNTSRVTDMTQMFRDCTGLTSLDLSKLDTSNVTVMNNVFFYCKNLTSLNISNWDTSNVLYMTNMFQYCERLVTLDMSNWDTSNVTDMNNMFNGCKALTTLNVSEFDTSKVTNMNSMFQSCSKLTSLDVSGFDTTKVTDMNGMFQNCSSLTSLNLSSFDTTKVTRMDSMFNGCSKLTSLDLSNFNTANVLTMVNMFHSCSSLTNLNVSVFNTKSVTDMYAMFYNCSSLTSLNLSSFDTTKVTRIDGMLHNCTSLISLNVENWSSDKVNTIISQLSVSPSTSTLYGSVIIDESTLPSGWAYEYHNPYEVFRGVTSLAGYCSEYLVSYLGMSSADCTVSEVNNSDGTYTAVISTTDLEILPTKISFNGLSNLTRVEYINTSNVAEISFNNSRITYINATGWNIKQTTLNDLFYACSYLTEIKGIETWNTSEVTTMNKMFYNCSRLTSLDVSGFDTSNVTDMNNMFYNCKSLTSLDVSGFDTGNVTDMSYMFSRCNALTTLDVSGFDTSNVTNMTSMFSSCNSLTSLDVSGFDTSDVTDMSYMFSSCSRLTSLDVSGFDTSDVTNMASMFSGCNALTTLDLSGFDTSNVTSMSSMFANCKVLTTLDLSGFDTSNVTSMSSMFYNCSNLTSLDVENWTADNVNTIIPQLSVSPSTSTLYGTVTIDETTLPSGWIYKFNDVNVFLQFTATTNSTSLVFFDTSFTEYEVSTLKLEGNIYKYTYQYTGSSKPTIIRFCPSFGTSYANTIKSIEKLVLTNASSMYRMFYGCSGLTSIDLSRVSIGSSAVPMNSMFQDCYDLTSINLSGFDTSNATTMNGMFYNCYSLTSLNLSGFDTSKVTNMSGMFYNCSRLTSLDLSGFDTSNVTDMSEMFNKCNGLTSLDVSGFDTSKITDMSDMFNGCRALTTLGVSNFKTSNVTNMDSVFCGCSGLTSLDLSGWVTSKVTDMSWMFTSCSKLTSLDLSEFDISKVTTMNGMFKNCSGLIELDSMQNISTSLDLSYTTLDVTSLLDVIDNLATVTTTQTLTLGSTSLAKLTEEQIAIAVNKGWTVS